MKGYIITLTRQYYSCERGPRGTHNIVIVIKKNIPPIQYYNYLYYTRAVIIRNIIFVGIAYQWNASHYRSADCGGGGVVVASSSQY